MVADVSARRRRASRRSAASSSIRRGRRATGGHVMTMHGRPVSGGDDVRRRWRRHDQAGRDVHGVSGLAPGEYILRGAAVVRRDPDVRDVGQQSTASGLRHRVGHRQRRADRRASPGRRRIRFAFPVNVDRSTTAPPTRPERVFVLGEHRARHGQQDGAAIRDDGRLSLEIVPGTLPPLGRPHVVAAMAGEADRLPRPARSRTTRST